MHEKIGRILSDEIANIEYANQKTELLTNELRLADYAIRGGGCDRLEIYNIYIRIA